MFKLIGSPPLGRRFRLIGGAASETPGSGVTDTFTVGADTALASYTGPMGTWAKSRSADIPTVSIAAATGRARSNSTTSSTVYRVGSMASFPNANYKVGASIFFTSLNQGGVGARGDASGTSRAGYLFYYSTGAPGWIIIRADSGGTATQLGSANDTFQPGASVTRNVELEVTGTGATITLKGYVDGNLLVSTTDTDAARITTQGYALMYATRQAAEFDTFTVTAL